MTMTHAELAWILEELEPLLRGSVVQKVHESQQESAWVLRCRRPGRTLLALLCADSHDGRLHLVSERPTQPDHPGDFTMLLRKWLQGTVIESIMLAEGDRVVTLSGHTSDPDWEQPEDDEDARPPRVELSLVLELTGRTPNLLLLGPDDEVLGMAHRDGLADRELRTGSTYRAPEPPPTMQDDCRWEELALPLDPESVPRSSHLESWWQDAMRQREAKQLRSELFSSLRRQRKKARRLVTNIQGDLERAEEAQQFRVFGELLQSAYGKISRGDEVARVPDYYQEGMPVVEIPLDPKLDLQGNIDSYFRQYRRMNDAIEGIEERLLEAMEKVDALEAAREELSALAEDDLEAFGTLRDRLRASGLVPRPRRQRQHKSSGASARKLPYREFTASSGATILVGRGSSANDELSLKIARGRDIWMHARDWAGAHVILRMRKNQEPHQADMLDAATLAAHFSRGKNDTLVDVTHTQAKYIRKPKGYPPGLVTVAGGSTIGVSIDAKRLERLLATEERT